MHETVEMASRVRVFLGGPGAHSFLPSFSQSVRQVSQSALTNASAGGMLFAFERRLWQAVEPVCAQPVWRHTAQGLLLYDSKKV